MYNGGLSVRSVQLIEQRLILRNLSRIYWLDELPVEYAFGALGPNRMV